MKTAYVVAGVALVGGAAYLYHKSMTDKLAAAQKHGAAGAMGSQQTGGPQPKPIANPNPQGMGAGPGRGGLEDLGVGLLSDLAKGLGAAGSKAVQQWATPAGYAGDGGYQTTPVDSYGDTDPLMSDPAGFAGDPGTGLGADSGVYADQYSSGGDTMDVAFA